MTILLGERSAGAKRKFTDFPERDGRGVEVDAKLPLSNLAHRQVRLIDAMFRQKQVHQPLKTRVLLIDNIGQQ
jgi:hypothetical protein